MAFSNHSVDQQTGLNANAQSDGVVTAYDTLRFAVDTTTATAGTLDITVQWSPDGTNWAAHSTPDAFTQITGTGVTFLEVPARAGHFRFDYAVATGPFTFTIWLLGFADR